MPRSVTDRSGTIATGGTAQELAPQNLSRSNLIVQNRSGLPLNVREDGTAASAAGSWEIPAGALLAFTDGDAPQGAISIWGSQTGQAFTAKEW